jgi:class 3 adenylate cyclase
MTRLEAITTPTELSLLVAFTGLAGFNKRFVLPGNDRAVFDAIRDYTSWSGALVQQAGGTVIKCIGDALMVAFPQEQAGPGVMALLDLKDSGDRWLQKRQIPCHHLIKVNFGSVQAGHVGAPGQERLDIFGKTVNICATLESTGFAMTPQAFRTLDAQARKRFKKHTPPVTYIRAEDSH